MKKKVLLVLMVIIISVITFGMVSVSAAISGDYTYTVSNKEAIITDCRYSTKSTITIPATLGGYPVTSIGDSAFSDCDRLENVTIPQGVISIGDHAFAYCDSLVSITVDNNNQNYCSIEGVLFDKNKTILIQYPRDKSEVAYIIPDSVTNIGDSAFHGCNNLENVTIPDRVTSIGRAAFAYCYSLASVTIGDSVTSIGDNAFYICKNLKSVTIGDSVTSIGNFAFSDCTKLKDVYYIGTKEDWDLIEIDLNNRPLTTATIHYSGPYTKTTLSNNDKSFSITPINIDTGKTIILALYNGEQFVQMQKAVYTGEAIPFTTTEEYTNAKVMVWDSLASLKPVCVVEDVK